MHQARPRRGRAGLPPLPGRTRQAHLRKRLQGSLAGLDQAPDHAHQREQAEPRRPARAEIPRRADGEAFLRIRSRRGFRLRATGQVGRYFRAIVLTPVLVPSRRTSAPRRANNPLVTTPAILLTAVSSSTGLRIESPHTSRTMLPLSVAKPSRSLGWPPSFTIWRATWARAIAITSTGRGNFPSTGTSFDSSAMQTNFFATAATIFSRVSAPPPPLIMARCSVISSAPSI